MTRIATSQKDQAAPVPIAEDGLYEVVGGERRNRWEFSRMSLRRV